ncbi:MAG: zinc dependent phospholipase C family protein [Butyrivibrio sp.]|nr:zinc dependent phospholipase C family protein [Butyrivibrio sp.]
MPGFVTHYVFGVNAYKKLSNPDIKGIIQKRHNAFSLGLQGPDIFFYFMPSSLGFKPNIANIMHKKRTGEFFRSLIDGVSIFDRKKDYEIAYAYIQGFMGHYLLDTNMHPYVYSRVGTSVSKQTLGIHFGLETDIDREVLMHYKGMKQNDFSHLSVISLNKHEKNIIARLLNSAILKTYGITITTTVIKASMVSFAIESVLLMDPNMKKHRFVSFIENHTVGYGLVSPLLINECRHSEDPCNEAHNEWVNPWEPAMRGTSSVFEMMDSLQNKYAGLMESMDSALNDSHNMLQDDNPKILALLGNNSYSSGFDCRKRIAREP